MTAVSLSTLLQALRTYLKKNPLSPDPNSERKETFVFKVSNQDNPNLPRLFLQFFCYSIKISKQSKCAIRGRRRLHVGFGGWHWGREGSETSLGIDCVHGRTPLQAVDELILKVETAKYHAKFLKSTRRISCPAGIEESDPLKRRLRGLPSRRIMRCILLH